MVWYLYAEGLEEFIWDWITLEVQDRQSQDTVDRDRLLDYYDLEWCSGFLSGLVAAAACWSSDGSPNGAVLRLLRAVEQFGLQSHYPNTVNLEAAGLYVARMVKSIRGCKCDPALFEQLVAGVHKWQPDHSQRVLARASFLLYHPTEVNGKPWFDVVRDVFDGENCLDQDPAMEKKKVRKYWGRNTLRAAYILSLKGDESKAAYLEEISQKHFPATWATRDERLVRFREDIRLKRLTRNF
ncbi:hypothetical protein KC333_g4298 [Hortaea werneckii]|nr:hypothetical protein KC333_g4298 [Hortaea werneckii]KAI7316769.1 hypothetical protein KC326_g4242 [Hortaea werneckii]